MSTPPLTRGQKAAATRKRNREAREQAERDAAATEEQPDETGDDEEEKKPAPRRSQRLKEKAEKQAGNVKGDGKKPPSKEAKTQGSKGESNVKKPPKKTKKQNAKDKDDEGGRPPKRPKTEKQGAKDKDDEEEPSTTSRKSQGLRLIPPELRTQIYENLAEDLVYCILAAPEQQAVNVNQPRRLRCDRIWRNGELVTTRAPSNPSFLQVNYEMRSEALRRLERAPAGLIDRQGQTVDFYHDPSSTVYILYGTNWDLIPLIIRSQIQNVATSETRPFMIELDDSGESQINSPDELRQAAEYEIMRLDMLRPFPNLRRINFMEPEDDTRVRFYYFPSQATPSLSGGTKSGRRIRETLNFRPVTEQNARLLDQQRHINRVIAADYARELPDRQVPVAEVVTVNPVMANTAGTGNGPPRGGFGPREFGPWGGAFGSRCATTVRIQRDEGGDNAGEDNEDDDNGKKKKPKKTAKSKTDKSKTSKSKAGKKADKPKGQKGPGRPKKQAGAEPKTNAAPEGKRGPGRPKKQAAAAEAKAAPKGKTGRPKKQ